MKLLLCISILVLAALAQHAPKPGPRGCISFRGKCMRECEPGTHSYTLGCGKKTPEPTCEVPHPVQENATICDYSACYCDPPTIRETSSKKCVKVEDCPKKEEQCGEKKS